jgi:hypothetical protein
MAFFSTSRISRSALHDSDNMAVPRRSTSQFKPPRRETNSVSGRQNNVIHVHSISQPIRAVSTTHQPTHFFYLKMQFNYPSIHSLQTKKKKMITLPNKTPIYATCLPSIPFHQMRHLLLITQYFNNFCPPLTSTPSLAKLHQRSLMLITSYVPSSCTGIVI